MVPRESVETVSWSIGRGRALGPAPFFVVGILNVTPDSFYDGGQSAKVDAAVASGLRLLDDGADILDIGGESTRPFSEPVSVEDELGRVLPVVQAILAERPDTVISVDTTKAVVARECLQAGATIINDVSGFEADPGLLAVLAEYQCGYVLMHSLGKPATMQVAPVYAVVLRDLHDYFERKLDILYKAGLAAEKIVLDPGIGFGKTLDHNLEILRNMAHFMDLGRPLYMGLSNKSLWKALLGREGKGRNAATLAATAVLLSQGVRIHRVHEVREARDGLIVAHALRH